MNPTRDYHTISIFSSPKNFYSGMKKIKTGNRADVFVALDTIKSGCNSALTY